MWEGLATEFAARGHEVLLMPRLYPGQPDCETRCGVQYRRCGGFSQGRVIYWDLVKDLVYAASMVRHLPQSDILVINDFWLPVLAARLRPRAGAVVVSANRFPKRQYRLYGRVARVIAASRSIQQAIEIQAPAMASRIRCIPNPFDTRVFNPPADDRSRRPNKTVLYVGRLHPEKNVDVLVRAFAEVSPGHPDARLKVVGPSDASQGGGGERYLRELRALAAGLPVSIVAPEFDVGKLATIYRDADLFCYPSMAEQGEALPVAPLEAMSTGLPVIVSALDCYRDILSDNQTGLIFDHRSLDPREALAAKLHAALSNWPRTLEIGRLAHRAAQRFSFAHIADELLGDFATLVKPA